MSGRYFEGNHPVLERRLEEHFVRIRQSFVREGFDGALVLGGGYGRGEGGVMEEQGELAFSNDLDYFLFDDAPDGARLTAWCRQTERQESAALGIDVEIKCLRADTITTPITIMMFADLVAGHKVVAGDAGFLHQLKETLDFSRIGASEATRLLWNRGSGMFFASCRMETDIAFVIRNHSKLKLALGDAWLCLHGQYTPQCRERGRRLQQTLPANSFPQLLPWHQQGVDFKFQPFSNGIPIDALKQEWHDLVAAWGAIFLDVERARLGCEIRDFDHYLALPRLMPDTPTIKNLALAARDQLRRGGCIRPISDYPRAGLMRALPCLLDLVPSGPIAAARFLPPPPNAARAASWENTYAKWWNHYS